MATLQVLGLDVNTGIKHIADITDVIQSISSVPTGAILPYGGTTSPIGYLLCDGVSYLRATYTDLFSVIGSTFGTVDADHFNVPDLQQKFIRGWGTADTLGVLGGSASQPFTPSGTVTQPTLSMVSYTPTGTISQPTFSGVSLTPQGTVSQPTFSGSSVTPTGTVTQPTFNGILETTSGTASGGTVTQPTFSGASGTTSAANTGTAPKGTTSSSLTLGAHTHTITPSGTVSQPTFSGISHTHTLTPTGTVTQPTFSGVLFTVSGTVSQPTFSGVGIVPSGTVSQPTYSGSATILTGTVTQPTFNGIQGTILTEPQYIIINYIIKT